MLVKKLSGNWRCIDIAYRQLLGSGYSASDSPCLGMMEDIVSLPN
jgi:hypothetical protein